MCHCEIDNFFFLTKFNASTFNVYVYWCNCFFFMFIVAGTACSTLFAYKNVWNDDMIMIQLTLVNVYAIDLWFDWLRLLHVTQKQYSIQLYACHLHHFVLSDCYSMVCSILTLTHRNIIISHLNGYELLYSVLQCDALVPLAKLIKFEMRAI